VGRVSGEKGRPRTSNHVPVAGTVSGTATKVVSCLFLFWLNVQLTSQKQYRRSRRGDAVGVHDVAEQFILQRGGLLRHALVVVIKSIKARNNVGGNVRIDSLAPPIYDTPERMQTVETADCLVADNFAFEWSAHAGKDAVKAPRNTTCDGIRWMATPDPDVDCHFALCHLRLHHGVQPTRFSLKLDIFCGRAGRPLFC